MKVPTGRTGYIGILPRGDGPPFAMEIDTDNPAHRELIERLDRFKGHGDLTDVYTIIYEYREHIDPEASTYIVNEVINGFDPWTASSILQIEWLDIAMVQHGDFVSGGKAVYPCMCGKQYVNRKGFAQHIQRCPEFRQEALRMSDQIPTHPSNRRLIEQVELWGGTCDKKKGESWKFNLKGHTVELLAPTYHDGNPTSTFIDIYRILGVTAQAFWSKVPVDPHDEKIEAAVEEAKKNPLARGHSTMVLDILIGQRRAMTVEEVTEMTGLSRAQVGRAMYYLSQLQPPLAKRLKQGIYEAIPQVQTQQHHVGIDVGVHAGAGTSPEKAPDGPVAASSDVPGGRQPEPVQDGADSLVGAEHAGSHVLDDFLPPDAGDGMDDLIIDFLDMVFPDGFNARHLPAIDRWRAATKALFQEMAK